MRKNGYKRRWLCGVLALMSGFILPGAVQANSGGAVTNIGSTSYYVGTKGDSGNTVTIDSDLDHGIIGGYHAEEDIAQAYDNLVKVGGGNISGGNVYGGYANAASASANNNSVAVNGSTVSYTYNIYGVGFSGGNVYGGYANADKASANDNSVAVNDSTVKGSIYGGNVYSGNANADNMASANNNSVAVNGSTVEMTRYGGDFYGGNVYGGHAYLVNGASSANNNSVAVNDSTVKMNIYGGYAESRQGKAVADKNSVSISGGTVEGAVYGGYALSFFGSAEAKNNKVILSGTADVSNADLYGSNLSAEGTNNNLVINGWSGKVNSLNNFDQLEVRAVAGGRNLTAGDTISLFTVTNGITDKSFSQNPDGQKVNAQAGVALTVSGNMGISEDNKDIYIDVTGVRASDQTVIATESRAASVAAVGRGAEAITDSLDTLRGSGEGLSTFASIIGSRSRYNTGSHADVNGWNGIVGTAWTRELTSGTLSCGAFYENGGGSYDTYNTINGRTYRGDGDTVYNGGGLLLRWETNSGTYTEASLRAGMVKNEVGPSLEFAGNRYGFKTENNYYGGHVGIGRIMERDDGDAWDIYGKYFHMHHEGDTVTIAGDEFAFDSVNSDRLRVGARYLDRKNGRFTGYYGLAYEYEFSGDTGGTANHHAMYTPSLQGSTVIGEIGFRGTPGEESPWSFEVSLRGYAGKQEGISGAVTAAYSF